jgi:hypothetical protein
MSTPKVVDLNPPAFAPEPGELRMEPAHAVWFNPDVPGAENAAIEALAEAAAHATEARQAVNQAFIEELGMHPGPDVKTRI